MYVKRGVGIQCLNEMTGNTLSIVLSFLRFPGIRHFVKLIAIISLDNLQFLVEYYSSSTRRPKDIDARNSTRRSQNEELSTFEDSFRPTNLSLAVNYENTVSLGS